MKFIIGEHISFINPTGHSQPAAVHGLKSALDGDGNNICTSGEGVSAKMMPFATCSFTASPADCQLSSLLVSVGQARLQLTQLRDTSMAKAHWNLTRYPQWCHKEWLTNPTGRTGDGQAWLQGARLSWLCHPQQPCSFLHPSFWTKNQPRSTKLWGCSQRRCCRSGRLFWSYNGSWTAPEASARRPTSPELAAALTGSDVSYCAKKIPLFLEEPVPKGIVKCWEEQWLQRWWEQAGTAEWWQHGETICISSFPPCEGCSEHAETLKHFARPNHQELIQYPSIPLWTLTKEEKELFCLLPQEIVAFFHAIYLKATFLLHSLSLIRSCNYLAICIPFLSKLVCYIAYKYVFVATRQVCPTVSTCHCLIQIHGLLFCSVYF